MSLWSRLSEMLRNAANALPSSDPLQALAAGLGPLDSLQAGLANQARRYVFDGEQAQCLQQIGGLAQASEALGSPGAAYFMQRDPKLVKAAARSAADRRRYYAHAFDEGMPTELLRRLGLLLCATDQGKQLLRPESPLPDWIHMILMDGVLRENQRWRFSQLGKDEESAGGKGLPLSVAKLQRLLALDDLADTDLLLLLFERKGMSEWDAKHYQPLLSLAELPAFLATVPAALVELPGQLSAVGRSALAEVLVQPQLARAHPAVLVRLSVDTSKGTREIAAGGLRHLPAADCAALLQAQFAASTQATERAQAAELLARLQGEAALPWLDQMRQGESSKVVIEALDRALSRGQAAQDSADLELPDPPPQPALVDAPLGEEIRQLLLQNLGEMLASAQAAAEREAGDQAAGKQTWGHAARNLKNLQKLKPGHLDDALRRLNGELEPREPGKGITGAVLDQLRGQELRQEVSQLLMHKQRIYSRPEVGLLHILRAVRLTEFRAGSRFWQGWHFQAWLPRRDPDSLDLRTVAEAVTAIKWPIRHVASCCLVDSYATRYPMDLLPAERIWPFFAEHPAFIEEGLGLRPSSAKERWDGFDLGLTLRVLACFPQPLPAWIPRLLELALGESKTHRPAAQKVLAKLPDLGPRVLQACSAGKQELRIVAVRWLAELGFRAAVPELRKLLAKESKEVVRAELLATLEALGEDISADLAPKRLLSEASKGLKAKLPKDIEWFAFEALPAAHWADGGAVPAELLRWWVVLAAKLKMPGGNPLLSRYLGLLDADSSAAFGRAVLAQFLSQDTRAPSLAEAEAHAAEHIDAYWAQIQQWAKRYPESYAGYTRERVYSQLRSGKLGIYLGSAIGAKGLLALIGRIPGHELAATVSQYMRDHYTRRAQIEALLEGMATSDDPAAIQLLLAVSRRHRTASVQSRARLLVDQIAERLGWSAEELADRTIPSAGLEESGIGILDYGTRQFTMQLDAEGKLELRNPEGKAIKALPDARKDEDAAAVKAAKSQFSAARKELKQVLALQTGRLYEAMCTQRRWPVADWQQYLAAHPIVGRLLQRLVWCEYAGEQTRLFRPSEDGSLLDAADEEIQLAPDALVGLAHGALLRAADCKAWLGHLKDYRVKPLFGQLDRAAPPAVAADATEIDDRLGWSADTFGFRGAFNKLGYQRAQAEDGGFFYLYNKDFGSANIRVVVEFSGNSLPEENVAASLRGLSFRALSAGAWSDALPLREVPPVLLAEAYADYHKVASIGAFDPHWESNSPW